MATNTSNNSIIISSASPSDAASDSDSTDYEPEPKKCKLENGTTEDGEVSVVESNTTVAIPIRAATSVSVVNLARDAAPRLCNEGENGSINSGEGHSRNSEAAVESQSQSYLTVGDLVEQTLQASLDRPPLPQTSMAQSLFSLNEPTVGAGRTRVIRGTASSSNISQPNPLPTHGVDFPSIAREVVVRMDGNSRLASQSGRFPLGRRRRRRRQNAVPAQNLNLPARENNNGSSSSNSSSEYFTDDIDPMEIPSDEYLSPPFPTRQRRNAIFLRRDPPAAALVQNEDDQYYHNELEVASVLDINENPIEDGSSTSGVDDEVLRRSRSPIAVEPEILLPEETDNNFADNENVKSDGDSESTQHPISESKEQTASSSEIPGKDKLLCNQCHFQKAEPFFRYCLRCFKIRRTWLPPRPASRRLKSRKAQLRNNSSNSLNNSRTTRSSDTSEGEDVVDGGTPASQQAPSAAPPIAATDDNSTTRPPFPTTIQRSLPSTQPVNMNEGFLIDDNNPSSNLLSQDSQPGNVTIMELFATPEGYSRSTRLPDTTPTTSEVESQSQSGSSSSQSQVSLFSINSQSTQSSSPSSQPLQAPSPSSANRNNDIGSALASQCSICYVREKDAAFVHNKIAHLYCCYTCADKILKKNGKCPICRERVLRVVKIINV